MKILKAFSMMELMVCVVAITIMASVLVPTITQKAKKTDVRINADQLSSSCNHIDKNCQLCYPDRCIICERNDCGSVENINADTCKCINPI